MKLGISIATYNEATNIAILLEQIAKETKLIRDVNVHVLVVDDNSPDGTAEIVKRKAMEYNTGSLFISVLSRRDKDGYGKACIAGFKKLMAEKVDFVMQMDADLSHNPIYLPAFVEAARAKHDFVIGSRYIVGGDTPDWPLSRRFLSQAGNLYARFFLGGTVTDFTGGFNLFSSSLITAIKLDSLSATGYGFLIELKYRAIQQSKSFYQIPIIFKDRQHGQSKLPKSTLIKNFLLVPQLRFSRRQ